MYRILEFKVFIFKTPNYIKRPISMYKCASGLIENGTRTHVKFNGLIKVKFFPLQARCGPEGG